MRRVFPDRPIVDLKDEDAIFHTIYDLDDRYQVPGAQYIRSGRTYEYDGYNAAWRGIYDDKGAWSSPSATTWIWAIPGSTPTIPSTRKNTPRSASASASTTSSTP